MIRASDSLVTVGSAGLLEVSGTRGHEAARQSNTALRAVPQRRPNGRLDSQRVPLATLILVLAFSTGNSGLRSTTLSGVSVQAVQPSIRKSSTGGTPRPAPSRCTTT